MSQSVSEAKPQHEVPRAEPQKQHKWLHKLVGKWTYEADMPGGTGETAQKLTGTERVRSLGGLWILGEGEGQTPGGGYDSSVITLGYDPARNRFLGTWIGSMMTHLWVYDGELDAAERVLTLNSEGPSMSGDGTLAKYQDVIEFKTDDHRTLTGRVQGADGQWQPFMTVEYRRT
jgi:hypothetical protein